MLDFVWSFNKLDRLSNESRSTPMTSKTPPAASRADERSARDALLDAAAEVMTEAESADVSLQAIAQRAGLTAPLTTYYFKTKEGLLLALARRDTERALEQLKQLLEMDVSPEEMLRIHMSGIIRTYARRPYLNQLLNLLLRDEGSASAKVIKDSFVTPLSQAQRTIIERGVAAGRFRPIDPSFAYFIIVGACRDFFTNKITVKTVLGGAPDEAAVNAYAKTVVDVMFNGLSVR